MIPINDDSISNYAASAIAARVTPLPCWLAVHREIRSNRLVRTVYDFLAEAIPRHLSA